MLLEEDAGPIKLGANICEDGAAFDTAARGNALTETASDRKHPEKNIGLRLFQRKESFKIIEHFDIFQINRNIEGNSLKSRISKDCKEIVITEC